MVLMLNEEQPAECMCFRVVLYSADMLARV
jgi:hypothetical protein